MTSLEGTITDYSPRVGRIVWPSGRHFDRNARCTPLVNIYSIRMKLDLVVWRRRSALYALQ